MKLLFKQRFFSWLDSYDIFDEEGKTIYTVEGKLSLGHCMHVYNVYHEHIATLKQELLTFMPRFSVYMQDEYVGSISREFTFFKPSYQIDYKGWSVHGDFMEWDYEIPYGFYYRKDTSKVVKDFLRFAKMYKVQWPEWKSI